MEQRYKAPTTNLDGDSGLGSDSESFERPTSSSPSARSSPRALECSEGRQVCLPPHGTQQSSPHSVSTGYDHEGSRLNRFANEMKQNRHSNVDQSRVSASDGSESWLDVSRTPETNLSAAVKSTPTSTSDGRAANLHELSRGVREGGKVVPSIESRAGPGLDSEHGGQTTVKVEASFSPRSLPDDQLTRASKMFLSQTLLAPHRPKSYLAALSLQGRNETQDDTRKAAAVRQAPGSDSSPGTSVHRSEESLIRHREIDLHPSRGLISYRAKPSIRPKTPSESSSSSSPPPPPARAAASSSSSSSPRTTSSTLDINHNKPVKNKNSLNLRLMIPAPSTQATQANPKDSRSTPTSSKSYAVRATPSDIRGAKKTSRARSLDSTPQSTLEFGVSSLPMPEKKEKRSSFSALRKFFSLNFRSKRSSPSPSSSEVGAEIRCRRRLFSEDCIIREETAETNHVATTTTTAATAAAATTMTNPKSRFVKNDKKNLVWRDGNPGGASRVDGVRSQPVTPTRDFRSVVTPESEAALDSMKVILAVFVRSSRNRIIKQLQRLECADATENGGSVLPEEEFLRQRKDFLSSLQLLFASFRELSIGLLTEGRIELVRLQAEYYRNSESYVQRLGDFVESSRSFLDALFAARVKFQFKSMAREVAKEGCNFLDSSHECVETQRSGADKEYATLDERFNRFSGRFEKLVKWIKGLEYSDTVSILW